MRGNFATNARRRQKHGRIKSLRDRCLSACIWLCGL